MNDSFYKLDFSKSMSKSDDSFQLYEKLDMKRGSKRLDLQPDFELGCPSTEEKSAVDDDFAILNEGNSPSLSQLHCDRNNAAKIGEGKFGVVYSGKLRDIPVAVKFLRDQSSNTEYLEVLEAEVAKLAQLDHSNILKYYGSQSTNSPYFHVHEKAYCSLYSALYVREENQKLDLKKTNYKKKLDILMDCCKGLEFIHAKGYLHQNIKPTNVLIFSNGGMAKIADFTNAITSEDLNSSSFMGNGAVRLSSNNKSSDALSGQKGFLAYLAPEILLNPDDNPLQYSPFSDVYAFGILMNEILTHTPPFPGLTFKNIVSKLKRNDSNSNRPKLFAADASSNVEESKQDLKKIIEDSWTTTAFNRPSFRNILQSLKEVSHKPIAETEPSASGNNTPVASILGSSSTLASVSTFAVSNDDSCTLASMSKQEIIINLNRNSANAATFLRQPTFQNSNNNNNNNHGMGSKKTSFNNGNSNCQAWEQQHQSQSQFSQDLLDLGIIYPEDENNGEGEQTFYSRQEELANLNQRDQKIASIIEFYEKGLFQTAGSADSNKSGSGESINSNPEKVLTIRKEFENKGLDASTAVLPQPHHQQNRLSNPNINRRSVDLMMRPLSHESLLRTVTEEEEGFDDEEENEMNERKAIFLKTVSEDREQLEATLVPEQEEGEEEMNPSSAAVRDLMLGHEKDLVAYSEDTEDEVVNVVVAVEQKQEQEEEVVEYRQSPSEQSNSSSSGFSGSSQGMIPSDTESVNNNNEMVTNSPVEQQQQQQPVYDEDDDDETAVGSTIDFDDEGSCLIRAIEFPVNTEDDYEFNTEIAQYYYEANSLGNFTSQVKLQSIAIKKKNFLALGFYMIILYNIVKDEKRAQQIANLYIYPEMLNYAHNDSLLSCKYYQYIIGICYEYGLGTTKDEQKAFRYYQLSSNFGYPSAHNNMGYCYKYGIGVEADLAKAIKYYTFGAKENHATCCNNLAFCYQKGQGVVLNFQSAFQYFKIAADQGHAVAQNNLGNFYSTGLGCDKSNEFAYMYYELSALQNCSYGLNSLGQCYKNGTGCKKDYQKAFYFFQLAVRQHKNTLSMANLGFCYQHAHGCEINFEEALKYYKMAIEIDGCALAENYLGTLYQSGLGVKKDVNAAINYYVSSAKKGNVHAQYSLAVCHLEGVGTQKSVSKGLELLIASAEHGQHIPSQVKLGEYYQSEGQNMKEAVRWYATAARKGDETALRALKAIHSQKEEKPIPSENQKKEEKVVQSQNKKRSFFK
jgi:TPR repeat protein/serine/threonine protein kinase